MFFKYIFMKKSDKSLNIKDKISGIIKAYLEKAGIENPKVSIDRPALISHGDFSSNSAFLYAKELKINPNDFASNLATEIKNNNLPEIDSVESIGGFVNIKIKDRYFAENIIKIDENFGKGNRKGKVMVEYTDPNPFKDFHIGHMMSNAIGESISRIIEFSGEKVIRANWQGDVGPHVAKALWGYRNMKEKDESLPADQFWGKVYVFGSEAYEKDEKAKAEIDEINKKIYDKSDKELYAIYEKGRKDSLDAFENIYKKLGTKFDNYFFEGKEGLYGEKIVKEFLKKGIFEESDGAIIFPGEKYGTHTRVFINGKGLPTYETKELGLNAEKFKIYPDLSKSIIITGSEQNDYFKVLMKVFAEIMPEIEKKTLHIGHGMMRFSDRKMSSRKGNVINAIDFIKGVEELAGEKIKERDFDNVEREIVKEEVAISAIKYSILRQSIGGDIVYNPEKALSFEGDSGPYLQYSCVRANTVIEKAKKAGIGEKIKDFPESVFLLEKNLVHFPDIVNRALEEYAPHHISNYLTELASSFNSYYNENQIISEDNPLSPYRVSLTKAFANVMKNGLWLLGIKVPKRM